MGRFHGELGGQHDAAVKTDVIQVERQGETVEERGGGAQGPSMRVLGVQRQAAKHRRGRMHGREDALRPRKTAGVDPRRHVGSGDLAWRRGTETRSKGGPQIDTVGQAMPHCQLPGADIAEVREVLIPRRDVRQRTLGEIDLDVQIARVAAPVHGRSEPGRVAGKTVRPDGNGIVDGVAVGAKRTAGLEPRYAALDHSQAVRGVGIHFRLGDLEIERVGPREGTDLVGRRVALLYPIAFAAVLEAEGDVQRFRETLLPRDDEISVHGEFIVDKPAGMKPGRGPGSHGRIHRVRDAVADFVGAEAHRQVERQVECQHAPAFPPQPPSDRVIGHVAGELGREACRIQVCARIVDRTVLESHRQQLADAGTPIKEAAGLVLVRVACEPVQLGLNGRRGLRHRHRRQHRQRGIDHEQALPALGLAPNLRGVAETPPAADAMEVVSEPRIQVVGDAVAAAGCLQQFPGGRVRVGQGVRAVVRDAVHGRPAACCAERRDAGAADGDVVRLGSAGGRSIRNLSANVDEPAVKAAKTERKACVAFQGQFLPVAPRVSARAGTHVEPRVVRPEPEVDDARDGVGAILGRRAVAQHLHRIQGDRGDAADIRPMRAEAPELHERRAMSSLAVDEDQHMVRIETAQMRRPDKRGAVGNRLAADAEGRNDGAQHLDQVGGVDALDLLGTEHVHRHRSVGGGARLDPGADGDHHLNELLRRLGVVRILGVRPTADNSHQREESDAIQAPSCNRPALIATDKWASQIRRVSHADNGRKLHCVRGQWRLL